MMKYYLLIILVIIQITHASQEKLEEDWVNIDAEVFVPGLLFQKNQQKQVEQKTKISLAEIVLDNGAVKNNDLINQYLSNTDLYFLLQASQTISNSVRTFMKKREQEQKEKEQILKECFLYDFNAFIDYARGTSLDYLEIEIPENVLHTFKARGKFWDDPRRVEITRSFTGQNLDLGHASIFTLKEYGDLKCLEEVRLKKDETFKFKFHFRQCLKILESHHVTFFGQTFEFKDLRFTLFGRPGGDTFKFNANSQLSFSQINILEAKYIYKNVNNFGFGSNPTVYVKMIEETGVKFKFKFHTSPRKYYIFDKPIYNFYNIFPNLEHYFCPAKQKLIYREYISKNSNVFGMEDQQYPIYQNSNFGQQQNPFYQSSNFGQQQQFTNNNF